MQSRLNSVSNNSANFHFSWVSRASKFPSLRPVKLASYKTLVKPLSVSNSVRTSFDFRKDFDFKEENQNLKLQEPQKGRPGNSYPLPIVICNSGSVLRYSWDGNGLKLVSLDGNSFSLWDFCVDFEDALRKLVRICCSALRDFFFPREVSGNYMQYVKWKFLHRVFSSALQVLATQVFFPPFSLRLNHSFLNQARLTFFLNFRAC